MFPMDVSDEVSECLATKFTIEFTTVDSFQGDSCELVVGAMPDEFDHFSNFAREPSRVLTLCSRSSFTFAMPRIWGSPHFQGKGAQSLRALRELMWSTHKHWTSSFMLTSLDIDERLSVLCFWDISVVPAKTRHHCLVSVQNNSSIFQRMKINALSLHRYNSQVEFWRCSRGSKSI